MSLSKLRELVTDREAGQRTQVTEDLIGSDGRRQEQRPDWGSVDISESLVGRNYPSEHRAQSFWEGHIQDEPREKRLLIALFMGLSKMTA